MNFLYQKFDIRLAVVPVGNGNCGSTCALFTTVMFERHDIKIATFGGYLDRSMEFKGTSFAATWWGSLTLMSVFTGTAGNQVLDWPDLDSDIKTAGLKNVSQGAHFSKQRSMTVPHRILLLLQTCTLCVAYWTGSANSGPRLVDGDMHHNWRTGKPFHNSTTLDFENKLVAAYSYLNETAPIAYRSEKPQCI